MQSFESLSKQFELYFTRQHFPANPATLYEPAQYILKLGGKRARPVICLMGNELFGDIDPHSWSVATAIELFHNFTLVHDDIMDKAPLRRGVETVHKKFGDNTALLAGDVMLVRCYDYLNEIPAAQLHRVLRFFNRTAAEVCEGQQMDMDFEQRSEVKLDEYLTMITLKTSVLLAESIRLGALMGGAGEGNLSHLYEFGKNLGIAFQVQDDYLDAFGDPAKFGKQVGGDILANKKTFLLIHALETAMGAAKTELEALLAGNHPDKVGRMLQVYKDCDIDDWALALKQQYFDAALKHLDDVAVLSSRKQPLRELAHFLVQRDY
jgi:geranylgeranyl diphosphate synthase, type II